MTIEDLKDTKIYLKTEDEVKQFQEKVFKLGVEWQEGGNSVDSSFNLYHISQELKLCHCSYSPLHFIDIRRKQIFLEDVLSIKESVPVGAPVLVRDEDNQIWKHNIFGGLNKDPNLSSKYLYICTGSVYTQCVPYEGNEHLLGTSNPA